MSIAFRIKRGTVAQINSVAGASGLAAGEPYLITDQGGRLAVGIADNAFVMAQIRGLSGFCAGRPANSEVVSGSIAPYAFMISPANCSARAQVAATASTVFAIRNNGTQIGTFTFAAGQTVATVSFTSTTVSVGNSITIHGPATADAALADISFLIRE
jgi:hypothetical protein